VPDRRRLRLLVVVSLLALTLGSCMQVPLPTEVVATPPAPVPALRLDTCPRLDAEPPAPDQPPGPVTDYVDFLNHEGRHYLAGFTPTPAVSPADLREVVLESRCSYSDVNPYKQQDLGMPRDGDTGFLSPGTPIRAVQGWPPECRLAVERGGEVVVYLAQDPTAERAEPAACSLD
jgi:hypothetical protein